MVEPEISYFGIQAHYGTTKHMGGLDTTKELIKLCQVGEDSYVLEVGCGVGATACYLAKTTGCRVVGVDLREGMIAWARERARREGVADRVEFRVADAQDLPFEGDRFDTVLCESVVTFVEDKQQVANELARVVKAGGTVGLNEEIWLQLPPPDMVACLERVWEIETEIPAAEGWVALLEGAGLRDVYAHSYKFDTRRESSQIKRYSLGDMWRMLSRTASLYFKNPEFRAYTKGRSRLPRSIFDYLGYGLFVGRK